MIFALHFKDGNTPLHEAAKQGFPEVAKILLGYGADLAGTNKVNKINHRFIVKASAHFFIIKRFTSRQFLKLSFSLSIHLLPQLIFMLDFI